jgi:hypothetical protein
VHGGLVYSKQQTIVVHTEDGYMPANLEKIGGLSEEGKKKNEKNWGGGAGEREGKKEKIRKEKKKSEREK